MSSWFPNRLDQFVGNFVQRFAELLATEFEVSVVHTMGDKKASALELVETTENNVRIIRAYHPISKNRFIHWWNQRKALRTALNLIEDVDLIFGHVLLPRAFQFIHAKRHFHRDLVVLEHGSYYRKEISSGIKQFNKQFLKRASRHIELFCAVSPILAEDIKRILPTAKATILPNFVDSNLFKLPADKPESRIRFLHVSTLDLATKDPNLLFEGFKQAYNKNKAITLTVISDQNTDRWQNWSSENGLDKAISWIGPSGWETVAAEMQKHDCVLVTSTYETFNIVIAEAWSSGLPVISTNVGIAYEMDPLFGIQLTESSPVELAAAIELFTSGALQFNAKTIRKHGLTFSGETVMAQMKDLFEPHFQAYE